MKGLVRGRGVIGGLVPDASGNTCWCGCAGLARARRRSQGAEYALSETACFPLGSARMSGKCSLQNLVTSIPLFCGRVRAESCQVRA